MTLVRFGHVFSQRGMAAFARTPPMRGDPVPFVEDFNRRGCQADVQGLPHEAMRDTIAMPLHFKMIIEMDSRVPPFGIFVGRGRERFEGWLFIRQELGVTRAGEFLEGPVIEGRKQSGNRRIQLG